MNKAFTMSPGAGRVEGQPLPFIQHELFDREGATSNAPFVESNIVGACKLQRALLLNKAFRLHFVLSTIFVYDFIDFKHLSLCFNK